MWLLVVFMFMIALGQMLDFRIIKDLEKRVSELEKNETQTR